MSLPDIPAIATAAGAPVDGPAGQALALGAPEALRHRTYWNSPELPDAVGAPVTIRAEERTHIERIVGKPIHRQSWLDAADDYLRGRHINATAGERALDIREDVLDDSRDVYLDVDAWLTAVGAAGTDKEWADHEIDAVSRAAVKAFQIERQLTDDGLLPAGKRVWTYMAYDLAGAVYLVQAGFRLGFADPALAAQILDAARDNAAAIFGDWQQFGISYLAARSCLHGSYPCDDVWRDASSTVRILLDDPSSPWVTLPFPAAEAADG
ncbi:MAG: DUF1266 domain-containing protein [Gordonia sp. (in: high G+C Gram-positive bacteria)]|uniref:DUF1266 domain-containing protein n=1 Tax=Gordonia sp. (in: high G+C Gram-positive bacteria) TaxID=84139 RepID=UPI0039E68E65